MASSITLENVNAAYGAVRVIEDVSVNVRSGETVALLGTNGNGKSTLMKCIMGIVRPSSGRIVAEIEGVKHDLVGRTTQEIVDLGIALVPEGRRLFPKLTVEENIIAVWQFKNVPKKEQKERLESLLEEFNLTKVARNKGSQLSGGERRRVEIARAMAANPSFLLLDEPFSAIDPLTVAELQKMIRKLKDKNLGILITDHNVRETLGVVDYAHILSSGEVVVSGSPEEIAQSEIARKHYLGEEFRM